MAERRAAVRLPAGGKAGAPAAGAVLVVDVPTGIVVALGGEDGGRRLWDPLHEVVRREREVRRLVAARWGDGWLGFTLSSEGLRLAGLAGRGGGLAAVRDLATDAARRLDWSDPPEDVRERLWDRVSGRESAPAPDRAEWERGLLILWRYWLARRMAGRRSSGSHADARRMAVPDGSAVRSENVVWILGAAAAP